LFIESNNRQNILEIFSIFFFESSVVFVRKLPFQGKAEYFSQGTHSEHLLQPSFLAAMVSTVINEISDEWLPGWDENAP